MLVDVIVVLIIVIAVALAIRFIIKSKKQGKACIGCPSAGNCNKQCSNNK